MFRVLIFLLVTTLTFAQEEKVLNYNFPEDFLGDYSGPLVIYNGADSQEITMKFSLSVADEPGVYNYVLEYEGQPARNYLLKTLDAQKGLFQVDEQNNIVLDARFSGNTLVSIFEVQGNLVTTTERFFPNHMEFEVTMVKIDSPNLTGGSSDEIPEVKSYPVRVYQKAVLERQ